MDMSPVNQVWPKPHCKGGWGWGKEKTRQTEEKAGRQHQGMDRPGVRQIPEGSEEQSKVKETGCEVIIDAPTTLAVKGQPRR